MTRQDLDARLTRDAAAFRSRGIAALGPVGYIDAHTRDGKCPLCNGWLVLRFAGHAPRAHFSCEHRCSARDILAAIWLGPDAVSPGLQRAHVELEEALAEAEAWRRRYSWAIDLLRRQLELEIDRDLIGLAA